MTPKLLVPLDGSALAEAAVPWATYLARTRGYTPVLAQAIPWPTMVGDGLVVGYTPPEVYDEILEAEREGAETYLGSVAARLAAAGIQAETVVRNGTPTTGLLDLAEELGVETIVMATHGRGGLPRAVLGSVANGIVQSATVPVLLVRAGEDVPQVAPAADRVLVPLDGSPLAERALVDATRLAHAGSSLVLVRVAERAAAPTDEQDGPPPEAVRDEAATYLKSIAARIEAGGLHAEIDVLHGAPAEQILAAGRVHAADVIVMGTHGRSGPARWLLGSVADEVARHADRPVLLVSARTRRPAPEEMPPQGVAGELRPVESALSGR